MTRTIALASLVAVFGLFFLAPGGAGASETVTLEGSFYWNISEKGRRGDLIGVFTPTSQDSWDVAFHFEWEGEPRVWKGSAQGSLTEGSLKGEVQTDDPEYQFTFRFSGDFKDGTFHGTHGQLEEGELEDRGTLTLQAPNS